MKFKIGEKVRCIGIGSIKEDEGSGWEKGLEFTIESVTDGCKMPVYWPAKDGNGVYEDYLELVKPIIKFKVGDKVRIIKKFSENTSAADISIGAEGCIDDIIKDDISVAYRPERCSGNDYCLVKINTDEAGWFDPEELELVSSNVKFKVGDRVRIVKRNLDSSGYCNGCCWTASMDEYIGDEFEIKEMLDNPPWGVRYKEWNWDFAWLDPVTVISYIRGVKIRCLTKKDWVVVVKQAIKDGCRWSDIYDGASHPKEGDAYRNCLEIRETGEMIGWWDENCGDKCPFLTTQEYLNKFKQTSDEKPNKQRKRVMSIIKNLFKTKEQKALAYYNLTNGDGGLTDEGRKEFADYLWETDKDKRKEFVAKIVEQYDEDHKRR